MKTTTNLGFKKPEASDFLSPDAFNYNFDVLDERLPKKADLGDDGKIPSSQVPSAATESALSGASTKDAPVDTDGLVLVDSEASGATKRILWSKIKSVLSGLFAAKIHTHVKSNITDFPSTMPPSKHSHDASDITSGTIPVARGGTGQTSISGLVNAIANGGVLRIQKISFTGTGTYTESDAPSVTFSFAPKFVVLADFFGKESGSVCEAVAMDLVGTSKTSGVGFCGNTGNAYYAKKSTDGKTLYWWGREGFIYNDSGETYILYGIG